MTLLRGHFAMVVLVRTVADAASVEAALKPLTAGGSLVIDARVLAESTDHDSRRPGVLAAACTARTARASFATVDPDRRRSTAPTSSTSAPGWAAAST